jgi:NADP-dependent 3-hydroxy acid dehydrogenase YdfG
MKIALVTGGSSGIGFAIARKMTASGMRVIIAGRRQDALDRAVGELGANASAIVADVSNPASLETLFSQIRSDFGRIDTLVANAGGGVQPPSVPEACPAPARTIAAAGRRGQRDRCRVRCWL